MAMTETIEAHIAEVEAYYGPAMTDQNSRLAGGGELWRQFQSAVGAWRRDPAQIRGVIERVNELVVAKLLMTDSRTGAGASVSYEPEIPGYEGRIDFEISDYEGEPLYVEVKTIHLSQNDNEENWKKNERRRQKFSPRTDFVVAKNAQGAKISGDRFASRASFLNHVLVAEERFEACKARRPGHAVLVFCGSGIHWKLDHLQDFVDYYMTGKHR